jgi:hypothetical protein
MCVMWVPCPHYPQNPDTAVYPLAAAGNLLRKPTEAANAKPCGPASNQEGRAGSAEHSFRLRDLSGTEMKNRNRATIPNDDNR